MTASKKPSDRKRVLYGRRQGRPLRPLRKRLLRDLLPKLSLDLPDADQSGDPHIEPSGCFPNAPDAVWFEVGFGGGEHLARQAINHPDIGFIGCEPFINGVASLLAKIDGEKIENIRILMDDARLVLGRLTQASLDRVFVLFPDPWPKTRHARRRFIGPQTLDSLAHAMKDGAQLRVASDDRGYQRWALCALLAHPDFQWMAQTADDWRIRPSDQPPTRYEEKARARGAAPAFLIFERCSRD